MLEQLLDEEKVEELLALFNEILGECLGPKTIVFNSEQDVRDIIYFHLPQRPVLKRREHASLKGNSDLELETRKTLLVLEFKRSTAYRNEGQALKEGLDQMQRKDYGVSSQHALGTLKRLRVCMVISTEEKRLTHWERLD